MDHYTINYKQTEYRIFQCSADSVQEAMQKWKDGMGSDDFAYIDNRQVTQIVVDYWLGEKGNT
ncbi:MAG: hypothetical protein ACYS0F_07990 [Planctomycetota bacterium]|jgi:hypothetical protein